MSTPFFELLLPRAIEAGSEPAKRGVANIRADVPGGRVRRIVGRVLANPTNVKGGITDGEESKGSEEEGGEEALTRRSP
ncbi:MAG: hypothetical protein EXQ48_01045 [Acidobacteria bacterium]|nr:hypothetical protein [Acidobacteriota bacterium]